MSVVVAFKYKDGIIVGADKRVSSGYRLRDDIISKISTTKYNGHAIGTVGMVRHNNLIAVKDEFMPYKDILDHTTVDLSYMIATIVPALIDYLKDNGSIEVNNGICTMESQMLYVTHDKIFAIGTDFSVLEYPTWQAIGCGEEMVMGLLSTLGDEELTILSEDDAIALMCNCIVSACKKDSAVGEECDYVLIKKPTSHGK